MKTERNGLAPDGDREMKLTEQQQLELEAATFRRLLKHLDEHKEVQNIELMNLASFCRNCLSKWFAAEARARGIEVEVDEAREMVYGMPYPEWKAKYQQEATAEQLARFNEINPQP